MTLTEFRMFFESLPGNSQEKSGRPARKKGFQHQSGPYRPDRKMFAIECDLQVSHLREIAKGNRAFTPATIRKVLPVMRKYGFPSDSLG